MALFDVLPGLARVALAAMGGYALLIGGVYAVQREFVFPRRFVNAAPFLSMVGGEFELISLETSDGERLKAYWKPPVGLAPVVVSFHGNGSLPEPLAVRFGSAPWADAGYGVLSFAYRGYPGSTGTPTEAGLLLDAEAALAFVAEHAPLNPLVLHGHSLGTGVAVAMSELHPSLALVLEAPFSSLPDVVAATMPYLPGFLMQDRFPSIQRITHSQAQTIIITHGMRDRIVPFSLGQRLFESAPHGIFLAVNEADHLTIRGIRDGEILDLLRKSQGIEPPADPVLTPVAGPVVTAVQSR